MNTLSSYSPLQQLTLTRFGRLKMMQRDVLPHLDSSDFRVKLTLKALYSTYQDLHELGLEQEARLLLDQRSPKPTDSPRSQLLELPGRSASDQELLVGHGRQNPPTSLAPAPYSSGPAGPAGSRSCRTD